MTNIGNIDKNWGRVYIGNDWCTFEAIEDMYEATKHLLEKRREQGLLEGQKEKETENER